VVGSFWYNLPMVTKDQILVFLNENRALLQNDLGVKSVGIFGSYARDEQTNVSDVDLIVELYPETMHIYEKKESLRKLLNDRFNIEVDVLNKKFIKPYVKDFILKDSVYAY